MKTVNRLVTIIFLIIFSGYAKAMDLKAEIIKGIKKLLRLFNFIIFLKTFRFKDERKREIVKSRIDFQENKIKLLNNVNDNLIDLGIKAIFETIQLDNSIQKNINQDVSNIYNFQVNNKFERLIIDELNLINAALININGEVLKNIDIFVRSKRQLILGRINKTLEATLNNIREWKILDKRKAKKLMEDRLNGLKKTTSEELKIIKEEINKLTKIKIEKLLRIVQAFFIKIKVYRLKYFNNDSKQNAIEIYRQDNLLKLKKIDIIDKIWRNERIFIERIIRHLKIINDRHNMIFFRLESL